MSASLQKGPLSHSWGNVCQFGAITTNAEEDRFKYSFQQSSPEEAASMALAKCEADYSMVQQVIDSKQWLC